MRKDLQFHVSVLILDKIELIWNKVPVAYRVGIQKNVDICSLDIIVVPSY